jgi:hypothetical protein
MCSGIAQPFGFVLVSSRKQLKEIVGLYVNPPNHAIVLSVDEKTNRCCQRQITVLALPVVRMISTVP